VTRPDTDDDGPTEGSQDPIVLGERYELLELVGRGGMAEVYRGFDRSLVRVVAVKLLPPDRRHDDTESLRLQDEARAAAGLSHPHVIAVHDVGVSTHGIYVVMELLGGRTWRDELQERGRLPEVEVARVGSAVASALAHAHAHGIVHRDVNPSNIMLLDDGTPKLMDFGIAKIEDLPGLTETGRVVGTAAYVSPEQARGERLDGRSDVYSLGCTLYELLTGAAPFRGSGSADVASARLREPPVPPRQVLPIVSVGMEDVVLRTMALDPRDRPDAASLAAALDGLTERPEDRGRRTADPEGATEVLAPASPDADAADAETERDTPPSPDAPPPYPALRRAGIVLVVLGVLALLVIGVLLALH
jgi:eukaryotic-like serine/threonine-protein kinase